MVKYSEEEKEFLKNNKNNVIAYENTGSSTDYIILLNGIFKKYIFTNDGKILDYNMSFNEYFRFKTKNMNFLAIMCKAIMLEMLVCILLGVLLRTSFSNSIIFLIRNWAWIISGLLSLFIISDSKLLFDIVGVVVNTVILVLLEKVFIGIYGYHTILGVFSIIYVICSLISIYVRLKVTYLYHTLNSKVC